MSQIQHTWGRTNKVVDIESARNEEQKQTDKHPKRSSQDGHHHEPTTPVTPTPSATDSSTTTETSSSSSPSSSKSKVSRFKFTSGHASTFSSALTLIVVVGLVLGLDMHVALGGDNGFIQSDTEFTNCTALFEHTIYDARMLEVPEQPTQMLMCFRYWPSGVIGRCKPGLVFKQYIQRCV